jgi:hypothetical protein
MPPCRARRLTAGERAAQGSECFAFFLQSGLGKGVLKDVWAAVAGDEGRLSQPQFVACLYLMELARRGIPPPAHAPPAGPGFPPIAGGARPGSGGAALGDTQQARPRPAACEDSARRPSRVVGPCGHALHRTVVQ